MKFFIDTEFHEYKKQPKLLGVNIGDSVNTIELISIGIVSEEQNEYYAICNDFDLKAAWNNEWLKQNVLKPIFWELYQKEFNFSRIFNISNLKTLINKYGKSREQIAEEIKYFIYDSNTTEEVIDKETGVFYYNLTGIEFYAYCADYDWVVFCWLFGRMMDLPNGFPMYCRDLKQILDDKIMLNAIKVNSSLQNGAYPIPKEQLTPIHTQFNEMLNMYTSHATYPKQTNEHNALADAKWNKELYNFLKTI